jgi:hypothetical protein
MNNYLTVMFTILIATAIVYQTASAQITINLPKFPKIGKQKPDRPETDTSTGLVNKETGKPNGSLNRSAGKLIYEPKLPTETPVLLRNSIYVQAKMHDEYWKMPGQTYSSWVPIIRFSSFYNNEKNLNYTATYFNPDGSLWYSEKLEQGRQAADRTVRFESPSPYGGILDTKSTNGIGVYSFKVTDLDKQEVIYEGKFKVGKFGRTDNPRERNKVDFFVDHDWLMPFGMIGFHHSLDEVGGMPLEVSFWLKGPVDANELEGRIFYKGQQIASTNDPDGANGVADYDERTSQYAPAFAPQNFWKRWQFQWGNFRFDNNGTFNHDYYPKAHYADKNPGDYTVKVYRNGTQIRELSFSIGADGRYVVPSYANQIPLPYYRIVLPVKVIGTTEKWNAASWKTDAFYGNPVNGFVMQ